MGVYRAYGVYGLGIIRTIVFWGLYWDSLILGNYPLLVLILLADAYMGVGGRNTSCSMWRCM